MIKLLASIPGFACCIGTFGTIDDVKKHIANNPELNKNHLYIESNGKVKKYKAE